MTIHAPLSQNIFDLSCHLLSHKNCKLVFFATDVAKVLRHNTVSAWEQVMATMFSPHFFLTNSDVTDVVS